MKKKKSWQFGNQDGGRGFGGANCKRSCAGSCEQQRQGKMPTSDLELQLSVTLVSISLWVVPSSISQMGKLIGSLEKQLTEKGEEINGYMEKHQIQVS